MVSSSGIQLTDSPDFVFACSHHYEAQVSPEGRDISRLLRNLRRRALDMVCDENSWAAQSGANNYQQQSYMEAEWAKFAETSIPLKPSVLARANLNYQASFQQSLRERSHQISSKVIWVNTISVLINASLALVAFYFAFANNSSATGAFAADCVLDFVSSAIVLWRYFGNLSSEYMAAREQIACIYLGALFEFSALAIIIKATSDMLAGRDIMDLELTGSPELMYLATVATLACIVLTAFKCSLYKELRDKSILLDVVNTLISTVFAMSLIMSQALISIDPNFWCLDPILSVLLALIMMAFGIKVLYENINILKPIYYNQAQQHQPPQPNRNQYQSIDQDTSMNMVLIPEHNYGSNLTLSFELEQRQQATSGWQKANYPTLAIV